MSLIVKPHITEKVASLSKLNQYVFIVHKKANKVEIKKQIQKQYNVTVIDINTARYVGKKVVRYTRKHINKGQKPLFKKAFITLKQGETLDLQSQIL